MNNVNIFDYVNQMQSLINWSQSDFSKSTIATDDRREGDPVQERTPRRNAKELGSLASGELKGMFRAQPLSLKCL